MRFIKVSATVLAVALGVPALLGVSTQEAGEYVTVVARRAASAIFGSGLKPDIELDRLSLLLSKLPTQIDQHQRVVAQAKVALEDAEAEQRREAAHSRQLQDDLHRLRTLLTACQPPSPKSTTDEVEPGNSAEADAAEDDTADDSAADDSAAADTSTTRATVVIRGRTLAASRIRRVMADRLTAYKLSQTRCETLARHLEERRRATQQLEERLAEWHSQRVQLAARVETLKLRRRTQALQSHTDTQWFNDADLARATEIADRVERELRVVETQQAMNTDPIADLVDDPAAESLLDEEVERALATVR